MTKVNKLKCTGCGKDKSPTEFYVSDSEFHKSTGKLHVCKECIISYASDDVNKLKEALRMIDKPFILRLFQSSVEEASKIGNANPMRQYMKNVAMSQYKGLTWEDSIYDGYKKTSNIDNDIETYSEEDKVYSKKWLGNYTPSEIEYLEEYIKGLDRDFRIVTLSHKDYAKKIAKASLHMDKCFQDMQEGVSGADKQYREAKDVFDTLSKSAKFSESQRGITDVGMGSISQIVEMVESETYVYEHKNDLDKDTYDKLIDDFKHIYKSL